MAMKKEMFIAIFFIASLFIGGCTGKTDYQQQTQDNTAADAADQAPSLIDGNADLITDTSDIDNMKEPTIDPNSLG